MRQFFFFVVVVVSFTFSGFCEDMMRIPRILKVTKMGNPILLLSAKKVEDPTDPQIFQIVEDMFATANDMDNCAGLAAPIKSHWELMLT